MPEVRTYYLEMREQDSLTEKSKPENFEIIEAEIKEYKLNLFLYQFVGESWEWKDKLMLSVEDWKQYAESENVRTWVAYYKGSIAGYYELEKQPNGNTEIAYFGLASNFIGKGFGGYLLSQAVKSAWSINGTTRVWVHTCCLDHPSALANYKARGFEVFREETSEQDN